MDLQHDYAAMWPDLFRDLSASMRETVLSALTKSAEQGAPPTRMDAQLLVDFATGRISAREFGRRTMALLTGEPLSDESAPEPTQDPTPEPVLVASAPLEVIEEPYVPVETLAAPAEEPTPTPAPVVAQEPVRILDHEEAALAFVRGEVTVEEYLRNARMLRSRPA